MPKRKSVIDDDDDDWLPSSEKYNMKLIKKSGHSASVKEHLFHLLNQYQQDPENNSSALTALQTILKLPTTSHNFNITSYSQLITMLNTSWHHMQEAVYGHAEAKLEILHYHISRLLGKGAPRVLGLVGPPGVGKTSLALNGVAKALQLPLCQISLGGLRDVTYFTGSLPCWKGSRHGIFADILITHGPHALVYMDEVDKVAKETAGDVYGWLTHALDPLANQQIKDSFLGIPLDLSGLTFIFSYNDPEALPLPLKDRIKEIYLSGFDEDEKIYIVKHFIWPECMNQYGLTENNIIISDDLIKEINRKLTVTEEETGVRYLKKFYQSLLDNLVLRITSKPEGFEAFFGKAADKCEEQATYVSPMTPEFPFEVQITDVYFLTDA